LPRPKNLIAVSVKVIRLAARETADTAKSKIDSQEGMVVVAAAEVTDGRGRRRGGGGKRPSSSR